MSINLDEFSKTKKLQSSPSYFQTMAYHTRVYINEQCICVAKKKHGYVSFWNLWIPCFQGHKAVHQVGIDSVTSTGHLQVFPYFDPQVWMQKHTSSLQETAYIMSYHIISTYRIQIDQTTKIHPGRLTEPENDGFEDDFAFQLVDV